MVVVGIETNLTHFEYVSTTIRNTLLLNGPAKSMCTHDHGALGSSHSLIGAEGALVWIADIGGSGLPIPVCRGPISATTHSFAPALSSALCLGGLCARFLRFGFEGLEGLLPYAHTTGSRGGKRAQVGGRRLFVWGNLAGGPAPEYPIQDLGQEGISSCPTRYVLS